MKVPAKTTKLVAAGLFLLVLALLVFAQAAFDLAPLGVKPSEPNQIVLLWTISTFIFLVLLVFGFILLRRERCLIGPSKLEIQDSGSRFIGRPDADSGGVPVRVCLRLGESKHQ